MFQFDMKLTEDYEMEPLLNLLAAKVEAVKKAILAGPGTTISQHVDYKNASDWLNNDDEDYDYSFPQICKILNYNHKIVRNSIYESLYNGQTTRNYVNHKMKKGTTYPV
jgi:hypothetical protein